MENHASPAGRTRPARRFGAPEAAGTLLLLGTLALGLLTCADYGITWDESDQVTNGLAALEFLKTGTFPPRLTPADVTDWPRLSRLLLREGPAPGRGPRQRIWALLEPPERDALARAGQPGPAEEQARRLVVAGLNRLLDRRDLYDAGSFWHVRGLAPHAQRVSDPAWRPSPDRLRQVNRLVLRRGLDNLIAEPRLWLSDHPVPDYRPFMHGPAFQAASILFSQLVCGQPLAGGDPPEIELKHLAIFLFSWAGFAAFFFLARRLVGPWPAVLALLFLVAVPRYWGESFNNPKDIPFAAAFLLAALALCRWNERRSAGNLLLFVLAAGFLMSLRQDGAAIWLMALLAVLLRGRGAGESRRRPALSLAVLAAGSTAVMFLLSPWLIEEPGRLLDLFRSGGHQGWAGKVLFRGHEISLNREPAWYLLAWTLITVPLATLAAAGLGLGWLARENLPRPSRPSLALWLPIVLWFLLPTLFAVFAGSRFYNGIRHGLYTMPPLALLAAYGAAAAWRRLGERRPPWRLARAALAGALALGAADTLARMVHYHPYEAVYFNRAIGGLAGAQGRYDTEYWGAAAREGVEWVAAHARSGEHFFANVRQSCWLTYAERAERRDLTWWKYLETEFPRRTDVYPAYLMLIPLPGMGFPGHYAGRRREVLVFEIVRDGAPLLAIFRRDIPPPGSRPPKTGKRPPR